MLSILSVLKNFRKKIKLYLFKICVWSIYILLTLGMYYEMIKDSVLFSLAFFYAIGIVSNLDHYFSKKYNLKNFKLSKGLKNRELTVTLHKDFREKEINS